MPTLIEPFNTALPADINASKTAGVVWNGGVGLPPGALTTDGNGEWFYKTAWVVAAGQPWDFSANLYLVAGAGRQIYDAAFFVTSPGANANGYYYRLDSDAPNIFAAFANGSVGNSSARAVMTPRAVWLLFTLSYASGTSITFSLSEVVSGTVIDSGNFDLATLSGPVLEGCFGQFPDGAGSGAGDYVDNYTLTTPNAGGGSNSNIGGGGSVGAPGTLEIGGVQSVAGPSITVIR